MGVFIFRSSVVLSALVALGALAQTERRNSPALNVPRDSAVALAVSGSPTEQPTPAKEGIGALEVLSDTQGVDFGPYLKDVVKAVRENWYRLIPEEAQPPVSKKGNLAIEFVIIRDGKIANVKLVCSSGYASLDRAAWAGITASNPLPRLPLEFKGDSLALRFRFYYNPDPADLARADPAPTAPVVVHAVAGTTPEKSPDAAVSSDAAVPTLCFPPPKTQTRVEAEAVGDQNGVDFSPYLEASVLPILRANWYRLVSKSAGKEGGQLTIEFSIHKDGILGSAKVTDFSGNISLRELALEGIEKSGPFPALPAEFSGQSLAVSSHFHYDPDRNILPSSRGIVSAVNRGSPDILPICNPNEPTQSKGDCLSPPRMAFSPDPTFTPEARQAKYQGTVMLSIIVATDGSVQSACALQSLGYGLDKQAVDAARKWKFEPATLNGKPMPAQVMAEVEFHLDDKKEEAPTSGSDVH